MANRNYSKLIDSLEGALTRLNISEGFGLLEKSSCMEKGIDPNDPFSISLLLSITQWIDLGFRDLDFLNNLFTPFTHVQIAKLRLFDFLQLRMVEGFRCLASENHNEAISLLGLALSTGEQVMRPHVRFIAHFWKSRAHRRAGEYGAAIFHIVAAREIALAEGAPKLAAVTKIHESWVTFQRGERVQALRLLDESENELKSTRHALFLGNIMSARGRFIRRSGEYAKALQCFERAIEMYLPNWANHPNCARALVNAAYVKRLIALDKKATFQGGQATGPKHTRYLRLFQEALDLLARAGEIYKARNHQSGAGAVLVNVGHLHLDSGDIDRAAFEATKAFELGDVKQDQILMARARILQSGVELAQAEEQIGDDPDIARHAALAVQFAEEAIQLATHTQNRRLLAEAYIARATAAVDDIYQDWELAKCYVSQASDLLSKEDHDYLPNEMVKLKARILRSTGIDHALRQWSDGQTGNKTFQQIQEEFAEIVIPKVWLNNGNNISKVSSILSVSPKKVRRILRNSGLLSAE